MIDETLGKFPAMLDLDEFTSLSDDKKVQFIFEMSELTDSAEEIYRKATWQVLETYTAALPYILEYQFDNKDASELSIEEYAALLGTALEKIEDDIAQEAVTQIVYVFQVKEGETGQAALERYVSDLRTEVNISRRKKNEAQAANRKLALQKSDLIKQAGSAVDNADAIKKGREELNALEKDLHTAQKIQKAYESQVTAIENATNLIEQKTKQAADLQRKIPSPPSEEKLVEAGEKVSELFKDREVTKERLLELENHALELKQKVAGLEARLETTRSIREKIKDVPITCPKCKHKFPGKTGAAVNVRTLKSQLTKAMKAATAQGVLVKDCREDLATATKALDEATKERDEMGAVQSKYFKVRDSLKDLNEQIAEHEDTLEMLKEGFSEQETETGIEELTNAINGKFQELASLEEAQKGFELLRSLEFSMQKSELDIQQADAVLEAIKRAERAVTALRNDETNALTRPIEKEANALLKGVHENLKLRYEISRYFRIMCRNLHGTMVPFGALSGGEKIIYSTAQLAAFAKIADPPLKILQSELGELSGDLVPSLLASVEKIVKGTDIQVMFASCHMDFDLPEGDWSVLNLT
jgi:chromosome segregation ATPase